MCNEFCAMKLEVIWKSCPRYKSGVLWAIFFFMVFGKRYSFFGKYVNAHAVA